MLKFIENLWTNKFDQNNCEMKNLSSRYVSDVIAFVALGIDTNSFDEKENALWKHGDFTLFISIIKSRNIFSIRMISFYQEQ